MPIPESALPILFKSVIEKVGAEVVRLGLQGGKKVIELMSFNVADYLAAAIDRASRVKTLLHRDNPIDIWSIYVKTYLKSGASEVSDQRILERSSQPVHYVIMGSAGSGKSMFMRYLFLSLIENTVGRIPILIELRNINEGGVSNLLDFIFETVVRPGAVVKAEQFRSCLRTGMFTLILDGFDEIDHAHRANIERQILNLSDAYPRTGIFVSSRPDDRLASWSRFTVYHVQPMAKSEVKSLLRHLPYDSKVKARFIKEVDEHLYAKHESFLSNPLLATMMLMTFDQFAHIPDKIHIFYEQAFETLFFRHDATKQAAFHRRMYSGLAINDFKNCLSALCVSSYSKEKFHFTESEIRDRIRLAMKFEKIFANESDFLNDLLESVCVLQRDGLVLSFTHRSFQEYFAAYFISRSPAVSMRSLLDHLCHRIFDSTVSMAFDMNKTLMEREWILPRLTALADQVACIDIGENIIEFAEVIYGENISLRFDAQHPSNYVSPLYVNRGGSEMFSFIATLNKLYAKQFKIPADLATSYAKKDSTAFRKALRERGDPQYERDNSLPIPPTISIKVSARDHSWLRDTSLGEFLRRQYQGLLELKPLVEGAVVQKDRMADELFS